MPSGRDIPLFDPAAKPSSWNERMGEGEFAVHYSRFPAGFTGSPYCTVLASMADAEAHAREAVVRDPELRCRIYDSHGLVGAPLRKIKGSRYKGETDMHSFRR